MRRVSYKGGLDATPMECELRWLAALLGLVEGKVTYCIMCLSSRMIVECV